MWIRSPPLRGREYKMHFNLTSCSSFYTMKVMLFTVPICLKARLYLVCACVCKSVLKSPLFTKHIAIQSSLWDFSFLFFSGFKSKQLKSSSVEKKAVYTSNSPCICLYNSLSLATRMCVSMSHISAWCVCTIICIPCICTHMCVYVYYINMHTMCVCYSKYICIPVYFLYQCVQTYTYK